MKWPGFSIFAVPLLIAIGGCTLSSKEPVLDPADAATVFGDRLVAVAEGRDGSYLDGDGKISGIAGTADGNVYDAGGSAKGASTTLSFYPTPDLPFDFIVQMHGEGLTSYFPAQKTGDGLAVATVSLSSELTDDLKKRGVLSEGGATDIRSAADLRETLRGWAAEQKAEKASPYVYRYRVAVGEEAQDALMRAALTEFCLSRAGHPLDFDVRELPKKYAAGVTMEAIDVEAAEKACSWGSEPGAPASVRYALARIKLKAEDYDTERGLIDALLKEDFPLAYVMRADQLIRGIGMAKDVEAGRRLLESRAERFPAVAVTLAVMYAGGTFGEPDFQGARRLYEQADQAGIAAAATGLGRLYATGSGVAEDNARAVRLFQRGADGGDPYGHLEIGRALYFGTDTDKDRTAAFGHLKVAAEARIAEAQYFVGFMLANGQGTAKSETEGVKWLRKASDAGSVEAKAELGLMTIHGQGVTADAAKGRALLQEAAAAGSSRAKEALADLGRVTLPPFSKDVPDDVQADVRKLGGDDDSFKFNRVNLPFMAGMAQYFVETCSLPAKMSDRMELAGLVMNGTSGVLGNDYSNPDILKGMGSMMGSTALFVAGAEFAKQIRCDSKLADHMATRLASASRSNKSGSEARFVPSCARAFDERRCACLAEIGRGVIPDIYQRVYDRSIIKEIISRNPITALTIAMTCQIGNY